MSSSPDVNQLELLAELDALRGRLRRWAEAAPAWAPSETCRAMIRRLDRRAEDLRLRWETPLVVATLGDTDKKPSSAPDAVPKSFLEQYFRTKIIIHL